MSTYPGCANCHRQITFDSKGERIKGQYWFCSVACMCEWEGKIEAQREEEEIDNSIRDFEESELY